MNKFVIISVIKSMKASVTSPKRVEFEGEDRAFKIDFCMNRLLILTCHMARNVPYGTRNIRKNIYIHTIYIYILFFR
jgi:hypothetical protein